MSSFSEKDPLENRSPDASGGDGGVSEDAAANPLDSGFRWTVENAAVIRRALLEALERCDRLELDFNLMTEIDLSGLQLLCAAHQSVIAANKRLILKGRDSERFRMVIREAGFVRTVGCSRDTQGTCLWAGGASC